jgi:hypothetical protein
MQRACHESRSICKSLYKSTIKLSKELFKLAAPRLFSKDRIIGQFLPPVRFRFSITATFGPNCADKKAHPMRENEFEFIRGLVYEHSRINLSPDKRELVSARLGKRLRATNLASVSDYCQLLKSESGDELAHLIDAISTNHTFFFREIAHFDFLSKVVLPEMDARAAQEHWTQFNVWSAACSSGEEPFSIAMVLADVLGNATREVTASDSNTPHLADDPNARSVRPDGNSVDIEKELLAMNRNMVDHQYLTEVVTYNIKQLKMAITGRSS